MGEYLRKRISNPLGADVFIGVEEKDLKRITDLQVIMSIYDFDL